MVVSTIPYLDEGWLSRIEGHYVCHFCFVKTEITDNFTIGDMTVDEELTIEKWIRD